MATIKKVRLNTDDLHKLKKHGFLRVGNYAISVNDVPVKQVKMYGRIKC